MADILEGILPGASDAVSEEIPDEITEVEEPDGEGSSDEGAGEAESADSEVDGAEAEAEPAADGAGDKRAAGDARTLPQWAKDIIKAHPDSAKQIKDLWFTNGAYAKFGKTADIKKYKEAIDAFGSFDEFTSFKDKVEQLGGAAAIEELQQSNQQYQELERKFDAGDPSYVDAIAQGNPEAFAKLAPTFLSRFGTDHPETYNHLMAQVVTSTLINNGMFDNLAMLRASLAGGDTAKAAEIVKQIEGSLGQIQTMGRQAPQVRTSQGNDPKLNEYQTKIQHLEQQQRESFISTLKSDTNAWVTPEIGKAMTAYLKGKQVTGAFKASLDGAVKEEVGRILNNNSAFKAKRDAAFKRGDREGILRLYKQFSTPLISAAVSKAAKDFGLSVPAKKAATTTTTTQPTNGKPVEAGWKKVTDFPKPEQVKGREELGSTEYEKLAYEDKFILKDGTKIQVVS